MRHKRRPGSHFRILLLIVIFVSTGYGEDPMTPGAAKLSLDIRRSEAAKPLKEFQEKYKAALVRLSEDQQAKGNLDAVLELKNEIETFEKQEADPKPAKLPELNSLRKIYSKSLTPILEKHEASKDAALTQYRADMEKVVANLTKQGKVDEAIEARKTQQQVEAEMATGAVQFESNEEIVLGSEENFTITPKLDLTKNESLYVLKSEANADQSVQSKRSFKTPFTVQSRVMTDGGNIRFYFGQHGIVIFNWEMNPKELRVNEPVGRDKHGVRNVRPLEPEKMYDIEIKVTDSEIKIYANKRKYGEVKGDFSAAEGKIGVGPAFGSTVSVEELKGIQEE